MATARYGLDDLEGPDPARRKPGLYNAVVFGRSVTNALERLKSVTDDGEAWYKAWTEGMADDEVMRYFYRLRNRILKETMPAPTTMSMQIDKLDLADLQPVFDSKPPGAQSFFMGDQNGGSGWRFELPDGKTEVYYVQLPPEVERNVISSIHLSDAPTGVEGGPEDMSTAGQLVSSYLDTLQKMIDEAEEKFGS